MTKRPWHVNAIKDGRIIGDETAQGWDRLHINGPNATVAVVYRAEDARVLVEAVNAADAADIARWCADGASR
jgi:hypothetical protein